MVGTFLEKHEGALYLGLDVSPVDDTAKFLRTRGFNIKGPEDGSLSSDPEQHDQPMLSWRLLGLETGSVPAAHIPTKSTDAIFFVQVGSAHPNTAKKLVSVWMGVRDLEASVRHTKPWAFVLHAS